MFLIHYSDLKVIPEAFTPSVLFSVNWGDKEAMLGNELTKEDTQDIPAIQITPMGAEDGNPTYTLAMLDPDAPSRDDPKYGPFRHWIVSNPASRMYVILCPPGVGSETSISWRDHCCRFGRGGSSFSFPGPSCRNNVQGGANAISSPRTRSRYWEA